MNGYKDNWFYRLCFKRVLKDSALAFVGIILMVVGVLLFTVVISGWNIALIGAGLLMVIYGATAFFSKMPKLKKQMERMGAEELAGIGKAEPQQIYYDTFYFTEKYLCAPSAYALIRYDKIEDVSVWTEKSNGITSYYVRFTFTDGTPALDVNVKEGGRFRADEEWFRLKVEHEKNRLLFQQEHLIW